MTSGTGILPCEHLGRAMIKHPDNFPDVDDLIETAAKTAPPPRPVLEYRPREADKQLHPFLVFLRRLVFTLAWAALAGGLGLSYLRQEEGPFLLAVGAAALSLFFPIPGRSRPK